ncbi:uncharacterized protein YhaN [Enterococcus sp. PF1-24]|uniref:ATP-binding protein n=1 Tax=unclassified Enterococcus TaxID=2608891 RepID=UPI002476D115|nr:MULTISPECIES: AAA family ATPase [unclassified Enterococcus]MDH6363516.1 uncharacterized protein YhaN [Enterococcus sp. PFB1-1]MDH6400610.1 uncharacterized protein YhaN [Enterococcus sp. PF1-24]
MKLLKAEIIGFGKWQNKELNFEAGNQLIFGLNEEGKSTIYHFIRAMLFGFPTKNKRRNDYAPQDGAAYGGRLWINHPVYGELMIERLKNKNQGKAQVFTQESVLDEAFLKECLEPLTEEIFSNVFSLNQEQLTNLQQLEEETLHEVLISLGASGSGEVYQLRQQFMAESQQIYKRRGQKQPLNQELKEWQALESKILEKQQQEQLFGELSQQQKSLQTEMRQLKEKITLAEQQLNQLQQQQLHWPKYEEWQGLSQQSESKFSEADLIELADLYQNYQQAMAKVDELMQRREALKQIPNGMQSFHFYLEHEEKIKALLKEEGEIISLEKRLQQLTEQLQALQKPVEIASKWGWQEERAPKQPTPEWQASVLEQYQQLQAEQQQLSAQVAVMSDPNSRSKNHFLQQSATGFWQRPNTWVLVVGVLCFLAGFFLDSSLRIAAFGIGGSALLVGVCWLAFSQGRESNNPAEVATALQNDLAKKDAELAAYEEQALQQLQAANLGPHVNLANLTTALPDLEIYLFYLQQQQALLKEQTELTSQLADFQQRLDFLTPWLPIRNVATKEQFPLIREFIDMMSKMPEEAPAQKMLQLQKEWQEQKNREAQLLAELEPVMSKYQIAYPSELAIIIEDEKMKQRMKQRKDDLSLLIHEIYPQEEQITKELLDTKMQTALTEKVQLESQYEAYLQEEKEIHVQLTLMQEDGTLDELYRQRTAQKAEIEALALAWGSSRLADNVLKDVSTELSYQQLPQLLEQASRYLALLTNQQYQKIRFEDNILTVANETASFSLYDLSTGTKDQVVMTIRLAFLALEAQRELAPVMIDDSWLHYDFKRKQQLAEVLAEFGKSHQIICFSSDREMLHYYQELQQPICLLSETTF